MVKTQENPVSCLPFDLMCVPVLFPPRQGKKKMMMSKHWVNRALVEGFPPTWTMNTISPIHKARDAMDLGNYRTIMIGHILAKLYGLVLEAELSALAETAGFRAP